MALGAAISLVGVLIVVVGLVAEFVAVAGMTFYSVRRALPFKSPIDLQRIGGTCFVAGVLLLIARRALS